MEKKNGKEKKNKTNHSQEIMYSTFVIVIDSKHQLNKRKRRRKFF